MKKSTILARNEGRQAGDSQRECYTQWVGGGVGLAQLNPQKALQYKNSLQKKIASGRFICGEDSCGALRLCRGRKHSSRQGSWNRGRLEPTRVWLPRLAVLVLARFRLEARLRLKRPSDRTRPIRINLGTPGGSFCAASPQNSGTTICWAPACLPACPLPHATRPTTGGVERWELGDQGHHRSFSSAGWQIKWAGGSSPPTPKTPKEHFGLEIGSARIRECLVWEGEVNPHPPLIEFPGLLLQPWRGGGGQDSCWLMKSLVFPNVPISFPLSPAINVHGPWSEAHTFLSGWRHGHRSGSRRRKAAGGTRGSRSAAATIACEL